jgi:hypothetical protein
MVVAIADRRRRIAALERLIASEWHLVDNPRYAQSARRVILQAEREPRRLTDQPVMRAIPF